MVRLNRKFRGLLKALFRRRERTEGHDPAHSLPAAHDPGSETPAVSVPPNPRTPEILLAQPFPVDNTTNTVNHNHVEDARKVEEDERRRKADDAPLCYREKDEGHAPARILPAAHAQGSETPRVNSPPDLFPTNNTGFLPGARDFIIENPTIVSYTFDHNQREDARKAEEDALRKKADEALEKLLARAMPSAMLYSEARTYAPKCDENTRQTLRSHIVEWGRNIGEIHRLLWLSGPAAVGKSAVAQTVAEEMGRLLGGVFFFSRPNDRNDPNVVIPTLVYQLAVLLPEYKLILGQLFKEDPLIFDKGRRSQFEALISSPFLPDLSHRPLTFLSYLSERLFMSLFHRPLLVVLDGLDECKDRPAQREFVEMIARHAQRDQDSRLRWMVCSRPEPHLTSAFASTDCGKICRHERLEVDNDEARKDALRILRKGFADIRKRYPDQVAHTWPHAGDVDFIADYVSGHLGSASFIIRFIGDEEYDNPSHQLKVCLKFLERAGLSNHNPLHALDLLYTQILSDIPKTTLPNTQRILGLLILYGNERLTALVHANFLGLDQATFYHSLQRLHSVIIVPRASEASIQPLRIHHASFTDYLRDETRAGEFVLDEGAIHLYVATRGLEWFSHFSKGPSDQWVLPEVTWPEDTTLPHSESVLNSVCKFAFTPCWRAFLATPKALLPMLIEALKNFDFNISYLKWENETREFVLFLQWLVSSDANNFASIDHKRSGEPGKKEEIAIIWEEETLGTFAGLFGNNAQHTDYPSIHLQLQTCIQTSFHLIPSIDVRHMGQTREDDIIILLISSHGTFHFQAIRTTHPKYGRRIVLVEFSEFGPGTKLEALLPAINWLVKMYRNSIKISGSIYTYPLTQDIMAEFPLDALRAFGGLCGDLAAARMFLVTTNWDEINPDSGSEKEAQLKEGTWKDLIMQGASVDRLANNTRKEAWYIVDKLLETANTGKSLKDALKHLAPTRKLDDQGLTGVKSRAV